MEVVIFSSSPDLEVRTRRAVETALRYRQGTLLSLHPSAPRSGPELLRLLQPNRFYLILVLADGAAPWLDLCLDLQRRMERVWFLVLGRGPGDCLAAVQSHLRMVDFLCAAAPQPETELAKSLLRVTLSVHSVCGGLFAWQGDVCELIPFESICYIETIKRKHRCAVVCQQGQAELRGNIRDLLAVLDARFCLCRASTIANLSRVREIDLRGRSLDFGGGVRCGFAASQSRFMRGLLENKLPLAALCRVGRPGGDA